MTAVPDDALAVFRSNNSFFALEPSDDESIPDVETVEQLFARLTRREAAARKSAQQQNEAPAETKLLRFKDGELDDSWTLVVGKRADLAQLMEDDASPTITDSIASTEGPPAKNKPRWRRFLLSVGSVAVAGVVSFLLLKRRNKKNE